MTMLTAFPAGNYRYVPGGFQYCAGVVADSGYTLESVRFERLVPLSEGFERIASHLEAQGRPRTALCACELRAPAPMDESDFIAFNRGYVQPLQAWGLFKDDVNPVARCNLVPAVHAPQEVGFFGFSYTRPEVQPQPRRDFITSGAAECPDQPGYRERIVRLGETSPDALRDKLRFALGDLQARFDIMGVSWQDVDAMNLYTVHDLHHLIEQELVHRGAMRAGLTWHWVRPPVSGLEIEVDARRVTHQRLLRD